MFDPWLKHEDPVVVANALIVLVQRTTGLLHRQMESLGETFLQEGGIRERMHKARTEVSELLIPAHWRIFPNLFIVNVLR